MAKRIKAPSVADVARELKHVSASLTNEEAAGWEDEGGFPVRLQVYEDGNWDVRTGDASWDTDHHGFWGAASVPGGTKRFNSRGVAEELIDEAMDSAAQDDFEIVERKRKSTVPGGSR